MSLFIVRIVETADGPKRTRLPGFYIDAHAAMQAMDKMLVEYASHGLNEEHAYWWARDSEGHEFMFVIGGE